ncbi:MAG: transcriptional regulator [Leptospiraceae bacterium]|nr:transcriptional regulator [Leptospiraceae bacterium]MCK6380548.1 transcriptional regulator [Leptospiraceae bacterium]
MKIESIYRHFLVTPVQEIPVISTETDELVGFLSKNKILLEMSDLSLSGKVYEKIPKHLLEKTFHENLIVFFQSNRLIPVLSETGEKVGEWDKPRFLAEFSKSVKKEEEKEKPIVEKKQLVSPDEKIQWFTSLILENFPDPLIATDIEGNSVFYNEKFEKEILVKPSFRNSIVFAERFLRDLNKDLFANFLKTNSIENLKGSPNQFLQTYIKQVDRILRVIPLEKKDKTLGFLYQFILPGNRLSVMGEDGMSFPSIEEAFHNKLPLEVVLNETESRYIYYYLKSNGNNISHTAKALGIPRSTLQNRIRQLNLTKKMKTTIEDTPIERKTKPVKKVLPKLRSKKIVSKKKKPVSVKNSLKKNIKTIGKNKEKIKKSLTVKSKKNK